MPRPRKPTALIAGHRTKAELAKRNSFASDPVISLDPPEKLEGIALRLWKELTVSLQRAGVLAETDMTALLYLCQAHEKAQQAFNWIDKEEDPKERSRYFNEWLKASDAYRKFVVEYGLTPSSRTRVAAIKAEKVDELDDILNRGADAADLANIEIQ